MTYRSTYNGSGIAIAICDTGVDYGHARLGGGGFPNSKVLGGYDFGDSDSNPIPNTQAHGTCCAGIAAGDLGTVGDYIGGVAYNAKVYALKISSGTTGSATTAAMVAAWDWCVTHQNDNPAYPIMAISTSFGGGQYSGFNYAIIPFWDDLRTDCSGGGVFTSVSGVSPDRIFNIEWRARYYNPSCNNAASVNFEVRLYEGQPRFDIVYGTLNGTGSGATVGVQKDAGSAFTQFECNTGGLSNGLQLVFQQDCTDSTATNAINTYSNAGSYAVSLRAVGLGGTNTLVRNNYVVLSNAPPVLAPIADRIVLAETLLTFTASASDPDVNQDRAFTLDPPAPEGASINPVSGVFTWTPSLAYAATTNSIMVRTTDDGSPAAFDKQTFNVIVVAAPRPVSFIESPEGFFTLVWQVYPGHTYRAQFKTNLTDTTWTTLGADFTATASSVAITNNVGTNLHGFYRVLDITGP